MKKNQKNVIALPRQAKPAARNARSYEKTITLKLTMDEADIEELECRASEESLSLAELVAEILHLWL
jgi:predicted DNA binding CopG/RHH family protein